MKKVKKFDRLKSLKRLDTFKDYELSVSNGIHVFGGSTRRKYEEDINEKYEEAKNIF